MTTTKVKLLYFYSDPIYPQRIFGNLIIVIYSINNKLDI